MFYEKGKTILPQEAEEKLLKELDNYRLVFEKTVEWEKLDEDRSGEDTEEKVYALINPQNLYLDILIIIDDNDYTFLGIELRYTGQYVQDKTPEERFKCALFVDGTKKGFHTYTSTYETPNNDYKTTETYFLRRV